MNFLNWLLQRRLSPSTAQKYAGAIEGALSTWAIEANLSTVSLTSYKDAKEFDHISQQIRTLPIFLTRDKRGHGMYKNALLQYSNYLSSTETGQTTTDIGIILNDSTLTKTEQLNLVKCRIGQGAFRQKLISYWKHCAVTGYKNIDLLVASHIKPWRFCTGAERLNPFNGLLLTPNLDSAFDAGLISFSADGSILISNSLDSPSSLGIHPSMRITLSAQHAAFMDFHRSTIFQMG